MSQSASLVKYNTPIQVSTGVKGSNNKNNKKQQQQPQQQVAKQSSSQTEDILNSILPPREWTEDGHLWVQYVSSTPATRLDVVNLQEHLDAQLQSRQARETGICPIREELYSQCYDELIRQITINCAERGLLLLRCRDEARMTISAYETLYESAIAYGIRKALMAEHRRSELEAKIKSLNNSKKDLYNQVEVTKNTVAATIKKAEEKVIQSEQMHAEEVERIQRTNDQLKATLESLLSAPKK